MGVVPKVIGKAAGAALAAAALALLAGVVSGHWLYGVAGATGLVIGSVNGYLAERGLASPAGFRVSSLMRLGVLTAAGVGAGLILGVTTLPFVIGGIALAQVLLAAVAVRETMRA